MSVLGNILIIHLLNLKFNENSPIFLCSVNNELTILWITTSQLRTALLVCPDQYSNGAPNPAQITN